MSGAIGYLLVRSAWNRTRRIASEFRKPGPRIAAAAAIGYFVFLAWLSPRGGGGTHDTQVAAVVGALGILVLVISAWLLGTGARLVELSGAERALLLPAPISGGRVMDVKLMRLQAVALGNALMWTALTSGGQHWDTIGRRVVAFWVVITTLQLHRIGAARSRASAAIHPALRRMLGLFGIGLVALVPVVLSGAIRESAPGLTALLAELAANPVARAVLWPFVVVLRPLTASSFGDWIATLWPALAILLLHYLWVRRLGPELERAPDPLTSPRGAPLWMLAPRGSAAGAFLWKNVTALVRRSTALLAAGAAVAVLLLPMMMRSAGRVGASEFLGWLLLMWSLLLLLMGPQFVRNDLRRDQGMLGLLRTLPVRGHEIILGSSGAAALTLASAVIVLLLAGAVATAGSHQPPLPAEHRGVWIAAAILVIGPVSLAGILLQNAAVILLPAWSRMTARRGTATALGTNLANSALTILMLALLLVVPGVLAFGVWRASEGWVWMLVACALVAALVLSMECWGLVRWLGRRFERIDASKRASLD
jgi:hypothetical protein